MLVSHGDKGDVNDSNDDGGGSGDDDDDGDGDNGDGDDDGDADNDWVDMNEFDLMLCPAFCPKIFSLISE